MSHFVRLVVGALLALWPAAALAAAVELVSVPERLELPLPPGTNVLLEARVVGAEPKAVWAAAGVAADRVPLDRTASGWALNLGDPALAPALAGTDRFRVYARMPDGSVIASVPVVFARREAAAQVQGVAAVVDGEERPAEGWFDPARVQRLKVRGTAPVVARVGGAVWMFAAGGGGAELPVDDALRRAWAADGTLRIDADGRPVATMRAIPTRLELGPEGGTVTVHQRRRGALPGSRDYVLLALDDITAAQVLTAVVTADDRTLVPVRSVREGETLSFELPGGRYDVTLTRMVNLLVGDDYAEFRVVPQGAAPKADQAAQIDALLKAVAASDATFVRNGTTYDAAQAAAHLRRKWRAAGPGQVATVDQFIDLIGSRSSASGEEYRVRTRDGRELPASEWLRELAKTTR